MKPEPGQRPGASMATMLDSPVGWVSFTITHVRAKL